MDKHRNPNFRFSFSVILLIIGIGSVVHGLSCPKECECEHLSVKCADKHLKEFPLDVPIDVRQLILTHNNLTCLPSTQLNLLIDLVYLDCSHNMLGESLDAMFTALSLVYLDLSHNNITKITTTTFYLLTRLTVLKLSDNPNLEVIEKDSFAKNTGLQQLDISRTALTSLDVSTVSQLPSLRTLGLSFNPWDCSCPLKDFLMWIMESDIYFTDEENMTCRTPLNIHGQLLRNMKDDISLMCFPNLYVKDYFFLVLVGFVIFCSGTALAWIIGVCTVINYRLCGNTDDDED